MIVLFFFFTVRSFQTSEHRCRMKIDETDKACTLVQTSSCHESILWTNVSTYWTYSLSFSLLLSSLATSIHLTLSTLIIRVYI